MTVSSTCYEFKTDKSHIISESYQNLVYAVILILHKIIGKDIKLITRHKIWSVLLWSFSLGLVQ